MIIANLAVLAAATLFLTPPSELAEPMRATRAEKFPRPREEPGRPGTELPPPAKKKHILGIGVGFVASSTLSGVALRIVLPDSPASRAGLVPGCIISSINGEPTAGRTGEECALLIRDGATTVRVIYLDPALKEKALVLEKEWLVVPE